jgi:hypothetical protein
MKSYVELALFVLVPWLVVGALMLSWGLDPRAVVLVCIGGAIFGALLAGLTIGWPKRK